MFASILRYGSLALVMALTFTSVHPASAQSSAETPTLIARECDPEKFSDASQVAAYALADQIAQQKDCETRSILDPLGVILGYTLASQPINGSDNKCVKFFLRPIDVSGKILVDCATFANNVESTIANCNSGANEAFINPNFGASLVDNASC